jgi:hypothetical protein
VIVVRARSNVDPAACFDIRPDAACGAGNTCLTTINSGSGPGTRRPPLVRDERRPSRA